ncbi:hypothetical protein [Clostridium sp. VAP52]|uniref:hypothetical protein n=1 Tax=Clostridium sp. VAP52 TaxID=2949977 RepID=UPI002079E5A9|nr:hypothetical protein [Clostridium sp. VAP52]
MEINNVLNKKSKIIENDKILINTEDLNFKEIEFLELNGYTVKLFNHNCVIHPYYQIFK